MQIWKMFWDLKDYLGFSNNSNLIIKKLYLIKTKGDMSLPVQIDSWLLASVPLNLSQWKVSFSRHRTTTNKSINGTNDISAHKHWYYNKACLIWIKYILCKFFFIELNPELCSTEEHFNSINNINIHTAPLGTRMAWTEPSDWLRADLRNSIWVEEKTSLMSVSWERKKTEKNTWE